MSSLEMGTLTRRELYVTPESGIVEVRSGMIFQLLQ
jgi:hypothetical protein